MIMIIRGGSRGPDFTGFQKPVRFTELAYRIAGKFGEFSESSVIFQTKTIQISTYNQ